MPQQCSRFTSRRAVGCVAAWAVASFKCLATDIVQQTGGLAGFVRQALLVSPLHRSRAHKEPRVTGANIDLVPSINGRVLLANIN